MKPEASRKGVGLRPLVYAAALLLSVMYIYFGGAIALKGLTIFEGGTQTVKARVTQIINVEESTYSMGEGSLAMKKTTFLASILSGENKGASVLAVQHTDDLYALGPADVKQGDKVLVFPAGETEPGADYIMSGHVRTDGLYILGGLFLLLLLIFGRKKGFNTLIALVFTLLSIFAVFIPSVLSGHNIYGWALMTGGFIILMTLTIVYGINRQSIAAAIGCFSGMLMAGALTAVMSRALALTGLVDDESVYLTMLPTERPIDLKAIIFAAIVIGAVGAIMDVAVSIASALSELRRKLPDISAGELFKSGITIGQDMMGTMSNTLVLAYIGGSLSMTLLLTAYDNSLTELLNREMIIAEILQILIGSLGILLTMPLTSAVCALIFCDRKTAALEA